MCPQVAEIVPATEDEFVRFYHGIAPTARWIGRAIRKGRLVAGFGGAIEIGEGEWYAFLDIPSHLRKPIVYRHILAGIEEMKREGASLVRVVCDDRIPRAEALLTRLGFELTDEEIDGKKVFIWQVFSPS